MQIPAVSPTPAPITTEQTKLKAACQQFESYFVDLMFKEMRKTIPNSDLLGDQSNQEQIFTGMMDQDVADSMSKQSGLGLSQMIYEQLAPSLGLSTSQPASTKAKKQIGR